MPLTKTPDAGALCYDNVIEAMGPMTAEQFAAEDNARAFANPAAHEAVEFRKCNPRRVAPPKGWIKDD